MLYLINQRRPLRLTAPQSFSEKVNWRIVYDRRELIRMTCDKLWMKEYATAAGLDLEVPRTVWAGTDVAELESVALPDHWVLKPNHRSSYVHFGHGDVKDSTELATLTEDWLEDWLSNYRGEWAYGQARRLLFVEERIGTPPEAPVDYKFFVFQGEVASIQVDTARFSGHRRGLYSPEWKPLQVRNEYDVAAPQPAPSQLEAMLRFAGALGREFDFIRVDLYEHQGRVYFGEITPYPGSGLERFVPRSYDEWLGRHWTLPGFPRSTAS